MPRHPAVDRWTAISIRSRFRIAYALLASLAVVIGLATARAITYRPPQPLAPQAVALVRRYLEALRAGDRSGACRIFDLPSLCAVGGVLLVERFTVSGAEPTVGGVEVPATIDDEQALFQLAGRNGSYRIVDVVADPRSSVVEGAGIPD